MLPFYSIVGQGGREGEPPQPLLLLYCLHYGQKNAGKGGDEKIREKKQMKNRDCSSFGGVAQRNHRSALSN
jgi:hypothetical protein